MPARPIFVFALAALLHITPVLTEADAQDQGSLPGDPNAIATKRYTLNPSLLYTGRHLGTATDPFAPADETLPSIKSTQEILSAALDIDFPEGTFAHYDPSTGGLSIRHHPAVIKAIEIYLGEISYSERAVDFSIEIFQMPILEAFRIQRLTTSSDDDTTVFREVQKLAENPASAVTPVTIVSLECRSGQRSKAELIDEFIYPTEVDWSADKQAFVPAAFETRNYGTIFEVDPVIGADDVTIDINLFFEHHTAPPTMHPITLASPKKGIELTTVQMPEFHSKRITTSMSMRTNTSRLIGVWKPTGKPEFENSQIMQVAFLRVAVQKILDVVPAK